jgi:hypothetical protein
MVGKASFLEALALQRFTQENVAIYIKQEFSSGIWNSVYFREI